MFISDYVGEVAAHHRADPSLRATSPHSQVRQITPSYVVDNIRWWKSPCPVLVRASGEQSPGATRPPHPIGRIFSSPGECEQLVNGKLP